MSTSRLSDLSIADDIKRVLLYQEILAYVANPENSTITYEIKPDDSTNHELCAHRIYGKGELRWLVGIICQSTDEFEPIAIGESYEFPPIQVLYSLIRKVKDANE